MIKALFKKKAPSAAVQSVATLSRYADDVHDEHLHNHLPYRLYDEENQIFHNSNSIGFGKELAVLSGANDELVKSLHNMVLYKMPEGKKWDFSFVMTGDNKVAPQLRRNLVAHTLRAGIYEMMNTKFTQFAEIAAHKGLPTRFDDAYYLDLKDYRAYFFCTTKEDPARLKEVRDQISMDLTQNEIAHRDMDATALLTHVKEILNHNTAANFYDEAHYNADDYLNTQMLSPDTTVDIEDKKGEYIDFDFGAKSQRGYTKNKTRVVTLGLRGLPQKFCLYYFPNCIANIMNMVQSIKCPFRISLNFHIEPLADSKLQIAKTFRSKNKWLNSPTRIFLPGIERETEEYKALNEQLEATGSMKMVYFTLNLTLFSSEDRYQADVSAAQSTFTRANLEIFPLEYGAHINTFMASLPFNTLPMQAVMRRFGAYFRIKSSNLVNFFPIVAEWKAATQGLMLPTFRNQIAFFDPFNFGTDNYNIAVTATSGAGKSFLVQAMIFSILSTGGHAYVIDVGGSYKKLCQYLGGAYLDHTCIRLNPFTHVSNIKSVFGNIGELILQIASPNDVVSDYVRKAVYKAVLTAFDHRGNQALIDDVQAAIYELAKERDNDGRLLDIADSLDLYTTKGELGELFNAPSQLDPNQPFTCLELEGFDDDVLRPVLFALMVNINEQMYLTGKKKKKICVIEEAWALLEGTNTAAQMFIKKGYRTARKFNGSYCAVTQRINDFFANATAEAAYANSDIKLILRQNAKEFKKFCETEAYKGFFELYEKQMIESFPTAKEAGFSSLMIQAGKISSFHRLFVDPFMKVLFTTDPNEQALIDDKLAQGIGLTQVIEAVAIELYAHEVKMLEGVA